MKINYRLLVILSMWCFKVVASGGSTHWGYGGDDGPENWGNLAEEFDICASGKNQSPIDLVADFTIGLPTLVFEYKTVGGLEEVNTGHSIQDNVSPGNYFVVRGEKFELKQFHFHSPSEHTVAGRHFPMEVHLVHQDDKGRYAVVGLLFQEGEENEILNNLPSFRVKRGEDPQGEPIDYNDLVLERNNYFLYNGSLTTPPCSEGVHWMVMKQPIIASPEQIQHYHDLVGFDNNRPIQPQNSRLVLE